MTQLESLKAMFDGLGIEYTTELIEKPIPHTIYGRIEYTIEKKNELSIAEGNGYYGFYCLFEFDEDGKFLEYGVWE